MKLVLAVVLILSVVGCVDSGPRCQVHQLIIPRGDKLYSKDLIEAVEKANATRNIED